MNFEVLKRSHVRRNILVAVLIIVLLLGIVIIKNRANTLSNSSINKESITKEINNNLIGAYIQEGEEYKQTDDIPSSGYEFNKEKSYCKIGDTIQEDITLFYDIDTQTITVSPITKEGLKCYLYFDEKAAAGETILASANRPTGQTTDWTNEGKGITYYYTGNPSNWVYFAGFYWRIIRINGDGTIRMIYQGTGANTTGSGTQTRTSAFNSSVNNNMYVGYMYQSGQLHGLQKSSTIKGVLDNWYTNNIANKGFGDYVDGNAGFCGDRRVSSGSGTGTSETDYQPYTRINSSSPSLTCQTEDIYTTSGSSTGNKALTQPIGLISADEAMFAGIPWSGSNQNNYLYTGQSYWTVSPSYFLNSANVYCVGSRGGFNIDIVTWTDRGVRPVINLKANVTILSGDGSSLNPYKITE